MQPSAVSFLGAFIGRVSPVAPSLPALWNLGRPLLLSHQAFPPPTAPLSLLPVRECCLAPAWRLHSWAASASWRCHLSAGCPIPVPSAAALAISGGCVDMDCRWQRPVEFPGPPPVEAASWVSFISMSFFIHLVVVAFRLPLHPRTPGLRPSPAHAGVSHSTWAVTLGRNLVSASPFLNL